jgi:diguanylate cyclase (GGDEF)-like protein
VRMFELRESAALPPWAAARLSGLYAAQADRLWRVFPGSALRDRTGMRDDFALALCEGDVLGDLAPAAGDRLLVAALRSRAPAGEPDGTGRRILIPLCAGDEVRFLIELGGVSVAGAGAQVGDILVPILRAYYEVLADSETDPLTRLASRRVFYSQGSAGRAAWAARPGSSRFLAIADIDHFKQVNDRFGHLYGDEILIHFAGLMRDTFRAGDLLYRFGGEEFVIVFETAAAADGAAALERFRAAVERYDFPRVGKITTSVGFTAVRGAAVPVTTLVDRADKAVYQAKHSGRNRVCDYETLEAEGVLGPETNEGGEATLF